jgi:cytoskeletal protein CcmA (bactofilin family)
MISGDFSGLIESDRLEIVTSGKVTGELVVEQLVIESGAQFNGTSRVKSEQPAPAPDQDQAEASEKPKPSGKPSNTKREKPVPVEAETS